MKTLYYCDGALFESLNIVKSRIDMMHKKGQAIEIFTCIETYIDIREHIYGGLNTLINNINDNIANASVSGDLYDSLCYRPEKEKEIENAIADILTSTVLPERAQMVKYTGKIEYVSKGSE